MSALHEPPSIASHDSQRAELRRVGQVLHDPLSPALAVAGRFDLCSGPKVQAANLTAAHAAIPHDSVCLPLVEATRKGLPVTTRAPRVPPWKIHPDQVI
jgi:hypothetical protein